MDVIGLFFSPCGGVCLFCFRCPLKGAEKESCKKDESQSVRFKDDLALKLAELGVNTGKPFRLWVVDEYQYRLISTLLRCWALPPYSPELSPIEHLWDQVAASYANRICETLDEIEEDISTALRPFWESREPVLRLLGASNCLLGSANVS